MVEKITCADSPRTASRSCGSLRIQTRGRPLRVSLCHCLECQKRPGSAFAVQARFPRDATRVQGESTEYVRTGDEGGTARLRFCPTEARKHGWVRLADGIDHVD